MDDSYYIVADLARLGVVVPYSTFSPSVSTFLDFPPEVVSVLSSWSERFLTTMNVSLRPKPGGLKSLIIGDCRSLIKDLSAPPKKFKLPSITAVYKGKWRWFTRLDLKNAYHSCSLPKEWQSIFNFKTTDPILVDGKLVSEFSWSRLPFGWDKSPWIFQSFVTSIIFAVLGSDDPCLLILIYLDDILICGTDFDFLKSLFPGVASITDLASLGCNIPTGLLS